MERVIKKPLDDVLQVDLLRLQIAYQLLQLLVISPRREAPKCVLNDWRQKRKGCENDARDLEARHDEKGSLKREGSNWKSRRMRSREERGKRGVFGD